MSIVFDFTLDDLEIEILEFLGQGSGFALADIAPIYGAHWGDLCAGAGEEKFVRDVKLGARYGAFDDFNSQFFTRKLDDGVTGNPD